MPPASPPPPSSLRMLGTDWVSNSNGGGERIQILDGYRGCGMVGEVWHGGLQFATKKICPPPPPPHFQNVYKRIWVDMAWGGWVQSWAGACSL